jgi:hypothetical protein
MKRKVCLVPVLIFTFILTGCITVFVPVETPTSAPTAIILPTNPPPPTETLAPASPTVVPFAPFCSVDPLAVACSAPKVETLSKSCIKKVPYTLVALPPGTTFETVETGLTCKDEGLRAGEQNISCTGQELISYKLKVCNPACFAASLETGTDHCPDGYGYSSAAGCCSSTSDLGDGCVVYKVDIGACPQ